MNAHLCIRIWRWPGYLIRVIIIVIIATAAARLDPAATIPLIAGIGLGGWALATAPALEVAR